jgi:hypothetical protein
MQAQLRGRRCDICIDGSGDVPKKEDISQNMYRISAVYVGLAVRERMNCMKRGVGGRGGGAHAVFIKEEGM